MNRYNKEFKDIKNNLIKENKIEDREFEQLTNKDVTIAEKDINYQKV